jgi:hypothetical protein
MSKTDILNFCRKSRAALLVLSQTICFGSHEVHTIATDKKRQQQNLSPGPISAGSDPDTKGHHTHLLCLSSSGISE